jgi:hypothetical protein
MNELLRAFAFLVSLIPAFSCFGIAVYLKLNHIEDGGLWGWMTFFGFLLLTAPNFLDKNSDNDFAEGKEFEELLAWEKFLNKLELSYNNVLTRPMGADLGYHSLIPSYDEHKPMEKCFLLDNKPCYYDGSTLQARNLYQEFLETNFDMNFIWQELQKFYDERIGE